MQITLNRTLCFVFVSEVVNMSSQEHVDNKNIHIHVEDWSDNDDNLLLNVDLGDKSSKESFPFKAQFSKVGTETKVDFEVSEWTKNITDLPDITHEGLTAYFNAGVPANKHKVEGYGLYKDGYVKKMFVKPNFLNAENVLLFLIKCSVTASMKKIIYKIDIHLCQKSGEILYGWCYCKAGDGGCCKHVSAALYQLVDYKLSGLKSIPDDKTCTDVLQQWNIPGERKNDTAIKYETLLFEKADVEKDLKRSRKRPLVGTKRLYCATPDFARSGPSKEKLKSLHDELKTLNQGNYLSSLIEGNNFEKSTFFSTSVSDIESQGIAANKSSTNTDILINLIFEKFNFDNFDTSLLNESEIKFVKDHLPYNSFTLRNIEHTTKSQSDCDSWHSERHKRITASNFGRIVNRRKNVYPNSLLKTLLTREKFKSSACKWGLDNEKVVTSRYETLKNVNVTHCGLVINPRWPWLACSPDGLVEQKAIEMKCPYARKDLDIQDACHGKGFFMKLENEAPKLKENHCYFYQCQGVMAELDEIDFIVYINDSLYVQTICFDNEKWCTEILPALTRFYFDFVAPKVFECN